jgi:hypothetical protein
LLLANAAFLVWGGFDALSGGLEGYRGAFLVAVAAAHGAIGLWFLRGRGDLNPFGLLATGTGLAAFSMAIPIQLGGPPVPIAWTAEAVALAWVAVRRRHAYSAGAATILGGLAIAHLGIFEYPIDRLSDGLDEARPFLHAAGGTLFFILGGLVLAGRIIPYRVVRSVLAGIGVVLIAYALPFELSGITLVASWAALYVATVALQSWPVLSKVTWHPDPKWQIEWLLGRELAGPAALVALLAINHVLSFEVNTADLAGINRPDIPFTDSRALAIGLLVAAALAGGFIVRNASFRAASIAAAVGFVAFVTPFELESTAMVVTWAALALLLGILARQFPSTINERIWLSLGAALLTFGAFHTLTDIAPLSRLTVDAVSGIDHPLYWSGATAALGALALVLAAGFAQYRDRKNVYIAAAIAAVLIIYLLSVGIVDEFQRQVGGERALEELQKQAQVGLSILWSVLGGVGFVAGILWFGHRVRLFSLALLGLATIKVFVVDLASLDAAYRVLSFIGLGILLLASSFAYQRLTPRLTDDGAERRTPRHGTSH